MGLSFCLLMGFACPDLFEGEVVAGVGVGEDGFDLANGRFGQPVDGDGAAHTFVTDMVGDHPLVLAAISGPDHRTSVSRGGLS